MAAVPAAQPIGNQWGGDVYGHADIIEFIYFKPYRQQVWNEPTRIVIQAFNPLARQGAPHGEEVKGKVFMTAVIAKEADMYSVLFALAEVDPSIHAGQVIVADSVGGQNLGKDGHFKMVSSEERRPARWVRNLAEISLVEVKP